MTQHAIQMIGGIKCANLPQAVADADWVEGGQEPVNVFWHGMRDATNTQETTETARRKWNEFIDA
jgi:hypothetical protein